MPPSDLAELWAGFLDPPDDARPRVWWHWMDGNVDAEGVVADLEWLYRVGVRGVQMFDGGMGTPPVVEPLVTHGSEAWRELVALAASTAERLGLEFAVATSSGWSAAGGPWVEPTNAMKKLVWSETVVEGGGPVRITLPPLPDVAGPYQDCGRWGADPDRYRYAQDWRVIAVPAHGSQLPLRHRAESVSLPRDPDGFSTAYVDEHFDEPVTVGAVSVRLPGPRGFGAAPMADAWLEASDDGVTYRTVARLPATTVPSRTAAFAPVTARHFRLVLAGDSAAAALPTLADGVRLPPVLRKLDTFTVSEFALWAGGRVGDAEVKAGFGVVLDYDALAVAPDGGPTIDPDLVIDLTTAVEADGTLVWAAPPGVWRVLRFGASLTGQTNGPAPAAATGLEVDKLDAVRVRHYLDTYLDHFAGVRLDALLSDSIESGPQNWTDQILERFKELRAYDPTCWLPALAGYVVGDRASTDAFLADYRRTLAELITSDYYGTVAAVAHERGLTYYAEALEDHRPQLGDDLAIRAQADVPMGAMWTFDPDTEPKPTYVADLKGASSVAHVHGKAYTGAESMSAFHRPWSYTPKRLKNVADLELALGVTRFCLHTSPHQPSTVPPPGISLSPHLGQTFTRHETWAEQARPWIDYLARCSYLLNLGEPAVDVAYFIGEEGPVTALFGDALDEAVPAGFDHDYVDLAGLESRFGVADGELTAGSVRYRLLYLGGASDRLSVRALRVIIALVEAGATVVGEQPTGSRSPADDHGEFAQLCTKIWSADRVIATRDLGAALDSLHCRPELIISGAEVRTISRRLDENRRLTFIANPRPESVTLTLSGSESLSVWDPVLLTRCRLIEGELRLAALGSVFVLTDRDADEPLVIESALELAGAWQLELDDQTWYWSGSPQPWTELGAAGFSGTGRYATHGDPSTSSGHGEDATCPEPFDTLRTGFVEGQPGRTFWLDLGDVGDLARVRINGVECGIAWTAPFRVDITDAVRNGCNEIEIEVTNAWMNRLIAEAADPTGELFAPVAAVYAPDAPVRPAGLLGPVRIEVRRSGVR